MELPKSTMKKLAALILLAALAFTAVEWAGAAGRFLGFVLNILSPFLLGAVIAFMINVPLRFVESKLVQPLLGRPRGKKKKAPSPGLIRMVSILLTLLLLLAVIVLVITVVVPQLAQTVSGLGATLRQGFDRLAVWAREQFASNPRITEWLEGLTIDWSRLVDSVVSFLKTGALNVLNSTITAARSVITVVTDVVVGFVFSFYLLVQKETLGRQFRKVFYALLPRRGADYAVKVCSLTNRVFSSFIAGQCLEALILGAMFFVSMTIFRLPYALLMGCLIAVTALIPIVGAFIGCFVGAILLLMVSPMKALGFVILFLVLQQLEGNLIYPHVVGSSVGLPSIWVLAAVTLGGSLMGVLGMLIFIPLLSVVYSLFRDFVNARLEKKQIQVE